MAQPTLDPRLLGAAQEVLETADLLIRQVTARDRRIEAYDPSLERLDAALSELRKLDITPDVLNLATQVRVVARECQMMTAHAVSGDDGYYAGQREKLRLETRLLRSMLSDVKDSG